MRLAPVFALVACVPSLWTAANLAPMAVPSASHVSGDTSVAALNDNRGLVALRYGALIYTIETADQPKLDLSPDLKSLATEWRGDLLGGVLVIKGRWSDGSPLLAIPNYARQNRGGKSAVWMKE